MLFFVNIDDLYRELLNKTTIAYCNVNNNDKIMFILKLNKASWTKKFNEPRLGKFTISPNNHIDAMIMKSTMCSCKSTAFRNVKNFLKSAQVVTLPFEGNNDFLV